MRDVIDKQAKMKTDKWRGYQALKKDFENLIQVESGKKGGYFPELHRAIMGFKGWLRGMHQQVEHLQSYIDEYYYQFNRSFMKEGIFENLLLRMVNTQPITHKQPNLLSA
jgi:hypothetical protein